jgi:hypothetical protein
MGYIIKDTQGLVITRLTDVGRRKIAQGNFNISYFQVGDSEINYTATTVDYDQTQSMVLEPAFNAQNNTGVPQSTKNNVKYPFYLQGTSGVQYGIPFQASATYEIFNTAAPSGFFSQNDGTTPELTIPYVYNSQYIADRGNITNGSSTIALISSPCGNSAQLPISADTYVAVYMSYDGGNKCARFSMGSPMLIYKVVSFGGGILTVDRPFVPLFGSGGFARFYFMYGDFSGYDTTTPLAYWNNSVINYESVCYPDSGYVPIWNMNIPWSESPAGSVSSNVPYTDFASVDYLGTKEYYGYQSSQGQTDTSAVTYYNSFGEQVRVRPEDQKAIAIVHYTNNTVINFFGEKFATEAYDPDATDTTGQARNFKITLPWLMWHKNTNNTLSTFTGTTFWIDPPGFDSLPEDLLTPFYIQSTRNSDMNDPGIRYYHLYDEFPNPDGMPSRVGKVFPDDRIIIFDDEEIIASFSYVANRNYTLPAPKIATIIPGSCGGSTDGILDNQTQCLWVTYLFESEWYSMHCNYYQKICGISADTETQVNVVLSFGGDFNFMTNDTSGVDSAFGWKAERFYILAQLTDNIVDRPNPANWIQMDYTDVLTNNGYVSGGYIDPNGMIDLSFTISQTEYDAGAPYQISNQLDLPAPNQGGITTNFGDEFFFYGEIETDITATIYEMRYLVNLPANQFVSSTNPSWVEGEDTYMTEIGLYDSDKNLMVLSKFQSPQIREGIQQVVVKLDF